MITFSVWRIDAGESRPIQHNGDARARATMNRGIYFVDADSDISTQGL